MPQSAQQFICKNCSSLSDVLGIEQAQDGTFYCICPNCRARNAIVKTGASPSQPGILPVTRLLD